MGALWLDLLDRFTSLFVPYNATHVTPETVVGALSM